MILRSFRPSFTALAMLAATCGYAAAQTAASPQSLQLVSANAQLVKAVNSGNATPGEIVKAKLTSNVKTVDGMKLDKGTVLIGQVEKAEKSTHDGPATLSLVFDKAKLTNGRTIPVKATLLGAYPASAGDYWIDSTGSGSMMPVQPRTIPDDQKIDQEPGALSHVALRSAVQSNVSGVFTSKDRNIRLKTGTRLQLAIAPEMTNG